VLEHYWLNEHGALINFENTVQHGQTRRSLLNSAEYNWMLTNSLDTANDPYDYFISDPSYATLLNIYNEVGVGDTVFVHYPQGIYKYHLHNSDARNEIRNGTNPDSIPGVLRGSVNPNSYNVEGCKSDDRWKKWKEDGDKKIKYKIRLNSALWMNICWVKSKTVCYKKRKFWFFGKWKRDRDSHPFAGVEGYVYLYSQQTQEPCDSICEKAGSPGAPCIANFDYPHALGKRKAKARFKYPFSTAVWASDKDGTNFMLYGKHTTSWYDPADLYLPKP